MQATHQDDVVRACQQRDPHACEQLVRSQQETALRTAYLLTGDTAAAVRLASDAFLVLVPELFHAEPDRDVRSWLLQIIAGRYLAGQSAMSGAGSAPAADAGTQRFAVDDERSRTLAALGRLDRQTRTLLVLHDFGRLDEANLAALLGLSRYDFAPAAQCIRRGRTQEPAPSLPRGSPLRALPNKHRFGRCPATFKPEQT